MQQKFTAAHIQVVEGRTETRLYENGRVVATIFNNKTKRHSIPKEIPKGSSWYRRAAAIT